MAIKYGFNSDRPIFADPRRQFNFKINKHLFAGS